MNYGKTKYQVVVNFYRVQLNLQPLETDEESLEFIEELFRIPFDELVKIPILLTDTV